MENRLSLLSLGDIAHTTAEATRKAGNVAPCTLLLCKKAGSCCQVGKQTHGTRQVCQLDFHGAKNNNCPTSRSKTNPRQLLAPPDENRKKYRGE
jgi:hypothetical protein